MATNGNVSRRKLNARQELFVQGLLVGKSADQAYQDAGYRPDRGHASRLATNGNVLERLAELRKPVVKAVQVTLEGHLRDLLGLRNMATTAGQFGVAITAEVNRGKAAGLYVDRKINHIKRLDEMNDAELRHVLGELDREIEALGGGTLAGTAPAGRA